MSDKDKMPSVSLINFHLAQLEYVRRCGHHFKDYEKCVEEGEKFDKCYKLYYEEFKKCYDKLLYSGF